LVAKMVGLKTGRSIYNRREGFRGFHFLDIEI